MWFLVIIGGFVLILGGLADLHHKRKEPNIHKWVTLLVSLGTVFLAAGCVWAGISFTTFSATHVGIPQMQHVGVLSYHPENLEKVTHKEYENMTKLSRVWYDSMVKKEKEDK